MTEVMINGKIRTIRDATLTKYGKIKKLHERGYTYRKIKIECKCGEQTIRDALSYVPNVPKQTRTSSLKIPPPPPIRDSVPIITRTKQGHPDKEMWDSHEQSKRMKPTPQNRFKTKDEFVLWVKTLNVKEYTGNRRSSIKRFQEHGRPGIQEGTVDLYIEFCKLPPVKQEMMNELKSVLEKRKNGGK